MQYLYYLIFIHLVVSSPQINLYYTNGISEDQNNCLRVVANINNANVTREMISYCMSESSSNFNLGKNDIIRKFTFDELSKLNITSEELYLWSAPIDLIEDYQIYLNQLSISNNFSLGLQVYYNCTWPRFGPRCQYQLDDYQSNHLTLNEIINSLYESYIYKTSTFTCYTYLQCNRFPLPTCLDWREICDGKVDCPDSEDDEKYCWQIQINQCKDDQYQCDNGQCIPITFFKDNNDVPDCLDASDEVISFSGTSLECGGDEPSFGCEEVAGERMFHTYATERQFLLTQAMFSIKDNSISDQCWDALICTIDEWLFKSLDCETRCKDNKCIYIIEHNCPDMLFIPLIPVLFGHIYFAYRKSNSTDLIDRDYEYPYICYKNSIYDKYFINAQKIIFNNTNCYYYDEESSVNDGATVWMTAHLLPFYRSLWEYNHVWKLNGSLNYFSRLCNKSNMYHCVNSSMCISIDRLIDHVHDCPRGDDEDLTAVAHFFPDDSILDEIYDGEDKENKAKVQYARSIISFQTICDGFVDLFPIPINGQNETDETECEVWECDNLYTRCNGQWNCLNGKDEIDCDLSISSNYSSDHHLCVSSNTYQLTYLPIKYANDGKVDCIGGTDEPLLCRKKYKQDHVNNFYCYNKSSDPCIKSDRICHPKFGCRDHPNQPYCTTNLSSSYMTGICASNKLLYASDVEKFLCERTKSWKREPIIYFSFNELSRSIEDSKLNVNDKMLSRSSIIEIPDQHHFYCHRGIDIHVWLDNENNLTTNTCFCPPSYSGNQCQYQNQRISLSMKFKVSSDSLQIPFAIVILLIDNSSDRTIHSYEQFSYLSIRDCRIKFNIYLLYSTRPRDSRKTYLIHMDIYEKTFLTYRGSLIFPIDFPFLPVHRLAFLIDIPENNTKKYICSTKQCINGKCIKYSNNLEETFCQCNKGWSGKSCTIKHDCTCASDSLCIGVTTYNRSICVCPGNKFGSRCYLIDKTCQTNRNSPCQNNGQCISNNDPIIPNKKFTCICPKGYMGDRCELSQTEWIISFDENIVLSQSIFIHFIEVITNNTPGRGTTFRTIPIRQKSIIISWPRSFNIVIIELLDNKYYLGIVQKTCNQTETLIKMIKPSDRCLHTRQIFNESFSQLHLLRRVKYYHLSCQIQSLNLSCFYDDTQFCLCYNHRQKRLANCFKFHHNMTFDCLGQSACQNDAQCLQDKPDCPTQSMCICPPCFYGSLCQFSTSGFGLSLDGILGYHILPNFPLTHQPTIIKFSFALTITFIIAGIINGILALITFKNKCVREVGCGLYLLGSSIITLVTIIMFGLKFLILLLAQMTTIQNRLFLSIQCHSIDFLLRTGLYMDQWLNACVATERAITVVKATRFNKKKSYQTAKIVIGSLLTFIIVSLIHDPIYRQLVDEEKDADNNQKKIWCIVNYPKKSLQIFNSFINIFHFSGPFIINIISTIILITKRSDQQSTIQTRRSYKEILSEQFREHKQLLIAPIILIILAIPRLIISLVSKCMISSSDSWLFLFAYFVSFIPPMLTFVVFILPSKFYKKQFTQTIARYRTNVRRRLDLFQ